MPYIFNWQDPEHTIIRIDMVGQVTWEEYNIVTDRVVDELAKTDKRIDVINFDKTGMPKGNPMPHLKAVNARMSAHKNLGLIITVSSKTLSGFSKIMVDIMTRAYNIDTSHNGGFLTSMEEALAVIEKSRKSTKTVDSTR